MRAEPTGAPLLCESWTIRGNDFEHGGDVSTRIKAVLRELGIAQEAVRRLSIANLEAEMNVVMYAQEATLTLTVRPDEVEVVVADRGPGIPDVDLALTEGWSTATPEMRARGFGAGLGLPNIKRSTDEFRIESTPGVKTAERGKRWTSPTTPSNTP